MASWKDEMFEQAMLELKHQLKHRDCDIDEIARAVENAYKLNKKNSRQ